VIEVPEKDCLVLCLAEAMARRTHSALVSLFDLIARASSALAAGSLRLIRSSIPAFDVVLALPALDPIVDRLCLSALASIESYGLRDKIRKCPEAALEPSEALHVVRVFA
jgi:hypothetical protein